METRADHRLLELHLGGSPRERGVAFGQALKGEIRLLLDEFHVRCGVSDQSPYPTPVINYLRESAQIIKTALPDIALEVEGVGAGAEISSDDAWLLQLWREAQACLDPRGTGDCSLFTATWRGAPFMAQTVDLLEYLQPFAVVLHIAADNGSPEILMFTFAGLLGYLGINSSGLAVGINMVNSAGWRPGVSPYLLVRHLLTQSTLADAQRELDRLPRASSRCLTLADTKSAIQVELTPDALKSVSNPNLLHTNHYLHPDLVPADKGHILLRRNSKARLNILGTLVSQHYGQDSHQDCASIQEEAERAFSILAHHGDTASICCHGRADHKAVQSVAAVVMFPAERELFLRVGLPCSSATQAYQLRGVPA